jgi:MscS family membrane protein
MGRACSRSGRMKSFWLQRRFGFCFEVCFLLAGLLLAQAVRAQVPKVATSPQPAQSQPSEPSPDPLGRTTPRGTVFGFLGVCYHHNYETAAQYLNTRAHEKDAATLAEQLFHVLDRRLPAKLNNLSNDPQGSMSDPLDSRRELVGTVASENGKVEIYLERVDRPGSSPIWLFSRQTLAVIPDIYEEINTSTIDLPPFLLKRLLGFTFFGWVFFLLGLPVFYVLLSLLNRLLVLAVEYGIHHWAKRPQVPRLKVLPHPIRLLILAIAIHLTLSKFSISLVIRQVGSITGTIILIVALVWLAILINGKVEDYLRNRMERQGRLGSTAILRPARRVIDVIYCVIGLMFALHSFGINPSAALAGLGVGGIAVALAAQKTLENVIGGASLILDEAVRVGDYFKMGTVEGTVESIGLRSTRVRTTNRTVVTIPNGQMATMTLENFSARDSFWFRHLIGIAYETSSPAVNLILSEVRTLLDQDSRVLPATTRVRFQRIAESNLEVELFAYVAARDNNQFLEIQEDLLLRIREVIGSAGVEFALPSRTIYLKNDTETDAASNEQLNNVIAGRET